MWGTVLQEGPGALGKGLKKSSGKRQSLENEPTWNCERVFLFSLMLNKS